MYGSSLLGLGACRRTGVTRPSRHESNIVGAHWAPHRWAETSAPEEAVVPINPYKRIAREVIGPRGTLKRLDRSIRCSGPLLEVRLRRSKALRNSSARRRLRLTAKARAALKLQGRYMGYVRQLKPNQKRAVKNLRESRDVKRAIALARRLLGK